MNSNAAPPLRLAWFIWGLGALLYLIGFFQRVAPAVITDELMRDLNLNATALGNLSAFYFYSYVAMQVPTGLMADAWGPRRLLTGGAFLAAAGTVIFAMSPGILWAGFGRLLIGGSVAVAFVGLLKIANTWFPPRYYGALTGMALFFGILVHDPVHRRVAAAAAAGNNAAGRLLFRMHDHKFRICKGIGTA